MKKHKLMAIAIATATACMSFMSCSDNNQDPAESSVELSYTLPASLNGATVSNAKVTFSDINTGRSQTFDLTGSAATVTVADGLYDVELSGEIAYTVNPNRSLEKASCHFLMTAIRKTALYMLDS